MDGTCPIGWARAIVLAAAVSACGNSRVALDLSGIVRDPQGAPLAGIRVAVHFPDRGPCVPFCLDDRSPIRANTVTNAAGEYAMSLTVFDSDCDTLILEPLVDHCFEVSGGSDGGPAVIDLACDPRPQKFDFVIAKKALKPVISGGTYDFPTVPPGDSLSLTGLLREASPDAPWGVCMERTPEDQRHLWSWEAWIADREMFPVQESPECGAFRLLEPDVLEFTAPPELVCREIRIRATFLGDTAEAQIN